MPEIFTVGHSNRPIADFISLLRAHQVSIIADVRSIPSSRHNPQFNQDNLRDSLTQAGIAYHHIKRLGGLRRLPKQESPNNPWRNPGFRAYAEYMLTPEFEQGLQEVLSLAESGRLALMCAEVLYWRCHRKMIAEALTAKGIPVYHIMDTKRVEAHSPLPFMGEGRGEGSPPLVGGD